MSRFARSGLRLVLITAVVCMWPLLGVAGGLAATATVSASVPEPTDRLIIKFRTQPNAADLAAHMRNLSNVAALHGLITSYLHAGALGTHVISLGKRIPLTDAEQIAQEIAAADPSVEYVEPDRIMHTAFTPNDPMYSEQWHYYEAPGGRPNSSTPGHLKIPHP